MRRGALLVAIGLVMIAFDLGVAPRFSIRIGEGFRLQLGALVLVLGAAALIAGRLSEGKAALSSDELARWGRALELATPRIVALCEARWSSVSVAETVARECAIPEPIVLKYLAALAAHTADTERRPDAPPRA